MSETEPMPAEPEAPPAPEKLFRMVDGARVPIPEAEAEALRADWAAAAPPPPPPRLVPVALLRERLEAAGRFDAAAALLTPAQILKLATLREGVDPADAEVRALLRAIGANADDILAIP